MISLSTKNLDKYEICHLVTFPNFPISLRFPKENSHEWIANLRPFAPGVINADNDRVCEKHFEKESIRIVHGRKILNVNVNPTLFEVRTKVKK